MPSILLLVLGYQELLIILVIVLVLFGATRVPQLMRGLGQGVKEFREALKDEDKPETEEKDTPGEKAGVKDSEDA